MIPVRYMSFVFFFSINIHAVISIPTLQTPADSLLLHESSDEPWDLSNDGLDLPFSISESSSNTGASMPSLDTSDSINVESGLSDSVAEPLADSPHGCYSEANYMLDNFQKSSAKNVCPSSYLPDQPNDDSPQENQPTNNFDSPAPDPGVGVHILGPKKAPQCPNGRTPACCGLRNVEFVKAFQIYYPSFGVTNPLTEMLFQLRGHFSNYGICIDCR